MWYVPITRDNPLRTQRSLAALKQEVEHRVQAGEMPVAGMALEDARDALGAIDSLERDAWSQAFSDRADRWLERAASVCRRFDHGRTTGFVATELQADEIRSVTGGKRRSTWRCQVATRRAGVR